MRNWTFLMLALQSACASSANDAGNGTSATSGAGGGGSGGSPARCSSDEKECDGGCVEISDPHYGCGETSCTPCPAHAVHSCNLGACAFVECLPEWGDCDADPANGCETSLATDAQNCGACQHDCAGSSCAAGMCAPEEVASGVGQPTHMVLRDGFIYWSELHGPTRIRRVEAAGGAPATLIDDSSGALGLAVDGMHVYWLESSDHLVRRLPKGGGTVEVVADVPEAIGMVADDDYVYVFDQSQILRVAKVGGAVLPIVASTGVSNRPGTASAPAVAHGDSVYWLGHDDSFVAGVLAVGKGGGVIATLAPTPESVDPHITADATGVFWTENENGFRIRSAPLNGGAPSLLVDAQHPVKALTTEASTVLWADTQALWRTQKTGGGFGVSLALAEGVVDVAADDVYAYFAGASGSAGYLKKVAK